MHTQCICMQDYELQQPSLLPLFFFNFSQCICVVAGGVRCQVALKIDTQNQNRTIARQEAHNNNPQITHNDKVFFCVVVVYANVSLPVFALKRIVSRTVCVLSLSLLHIVPFIWLCLSLFCYSSNNGNNNYYL